MKPDILFCHTTLSSHHEIVELMTDEGEHVEYEIYFNVTKPTSKDAPMQLYVQSAYIRSKGSKPYRRKTKKIHFFVIAYNRKVGKPIKTPA